MSPNDTPACVGESELFDSTNFTMHRIARLYCSRCPVVDWCRDRLAQAQEDACGTYGGAPEGTWAGLLVVRGRIVSEEVSRVA